VTPPTKHRGTRITPDTPLSARELAFVIEYLTHFSPMRAALAVGYRGKGIRVTAARLLTKPHIQAALQQQMTARAARLGITADRVLKDIDNAANLRIGEIFDTKGNLRPIHELPDHVQRAIVSIEVVKRNLTGGDGATDTLYKIKTIDKGKMQEILAKHTGLYSDAPDPRPPVPAFALPADTPGVSVH
jgi:phage terminase small subunit